MWTGRGKALWIEKDRDRRRLLPACEYVKVRRSLCRISGASNANSFPTAHSKSPICFPSGRSKDLPFPAKCILQSIS